MSPAIISLLVQLVTGAAGGNVVGALLKNLPVGKILATVLGAVGGAGGAQLAGLLPMLEGLLGAGVAGDAGVGAGGGALLTLIVGMIKKAMAGGQPAGDDA